MPMTIHFIKHEATLMLLSKVRECQQKSYSSGLNIINERQHVQVKGNTYKCHLILLMLRTVDSNQIQIANSLIKNSLFEKLFGVKFDHQLTFDQHVKSFCKEANAKLEVFARVVSYIGLAKKKLRNEYFFTG